MPCASWSSSFSGPPAGIAGLPAHWIRALFLIVCLALTGCATLPDVRYLSSNLAPVENPTVAGVSERKANAVLERRWKNSRVDLKTLAALEEAATGSPLYAGNKVSLLFDGPQTFAAMNAAIATAKSHIHLETYIFDDDELGDQFADLLIRKQQEGISVSIIYDSVGTIGTPAEFFKRMRDAGIQLVEFNPVNPLKRFGRWRLNNRDHRKMLIVDGKIAFTGGVNISGDYSKSSQFRARRKLTADQVGWRDTHIQIEGPAVAAFQWLFLDEWSRQNGPVLPDLEYFPPLKPEGGKVVRVLASRPGSNFEIYKAYMLAIQEAKKTIHISTPYFSPDAQVIDALIQAAGRGVDVKIIFPSVTDSGLVFYAGQSYYDQLLAAGIKIYQLQLAVLHSKTAVIDGVWSTVGSANVDTRSFLHNNEINAVILGERFGSEMEIAFEEDLRGSVEVTREKWAQRSRVQRIKEWAARSLEYWL